MRTSTLAIALGALAATPMVLPESAEAQRGRPRRTQEIVIRGQVPTPQVVTVRPREVPSFSRQVLVPSFYDHTFWPLILPAYAIVPRSEVVGQEAADSLLAPSVAGAGAGPGVPGAQAAAPIVPTPQPAGAPVTARPADITTPEGRAQEIQSIRQELARHRARLDSLLNRQRAALDSAEARARRRLQQLPPAPADTTRRPPGTAPATPR